MPEYKEELTVTSTVYGMKPMFGFRNTFIYDAQGNPCYKTWSMGAFVDKAAGKLKRVDDATIASMKLEPQLEMNYKDRRMSQRVCTCPYSSCVEKRREVNCFCFIFICLGFYCLYCDERLYYNAISCKKVTNHVQPFFLNTCLKTGSSEVEANKSIHEWGFITPRLLKISNVGCFH